MAFDFNGYYDHVTKKYGQMDADSVAGLAFMKAKDKLPDDTLDTWSERQGISGALGDMRENERQADIQVQAAENVKNTSSFVRGIKSGIDNTQGLVEGAIGLAGDALGLDSVRDWGFKGYKKNQDEAALNPTMKGAESLDKLWDDFSFEKASDYVSHGLGGLIPTMATMVAGAGPVGIGLKAVGGTALKKIMGKQLVDRVGEKMISRGVNKMIASGIEKTAAEALAAKTLTNKVGLLAVSSVIESGGMYGEVVTTLRDKLVKQGIHQDDATMQALEETSAGVAAGFGMVAGSLELVGGNMRVFEKLWGTGVKRTIESALKAAKKSPNMRGRVMNILRDVIKEAAREAPNEFGQEVAQEFMAISNLNFQDPEFGPILANKNLWRMGDAGFIGAVGGVAGGVGHTAANAIPGRSVRNAAEQITQLKTRIAVQEEALAKGKDVPGMVEALARNKSVLENAITEAKADSDRLSFSEVARLLNTEAPALSGKTTTNKTVKKLVEAGKLELDPAGFVTRKSAESFAAKSANGRVTLGGKAMPLAEAIKNNTFPSSQLISGRNTQTADFGNTQTADFGNTQTADFGNTQSVGFDEDSRTSDVMPGSVPITSIDKDGARAVKHVTPVVQNSEVGYMGDDGNFVEMSPSELGEVSESMEQNERIDEQYDGLISTISQRMAKKGDTAVLDKEAVESKVNAILAGTVDEDINQIKLPKTNLGKDLFAKIIQVKEKYPNQKITLKDVLREVVIENSIKDKKTSVDKGESSRISGAISKVTQAVQQQSGGGSTITPLDAMSMALADPEHEALVASGLTAQEVEMLTDQSFESVAERMANMFKSKDIAFDEDSMRELDIKTPIKQTAEPVTDRTAEPVTDRTAELVTDRTAELATDQSAEHPVTDQSVAIPELDQSVEPQTDRVKEETETDRVLEEPMVEEDNEAVIPENLKDREDRDNAEAKDTQSKTQAELDEDALFNADYSIDEKKVAQSIVDIEKRVVDMNLGDRAFSVAKAAISKVFQKYVKLVKSGKITEENFDEWQIQDEVLQAVLSEQTALRDGREGSWAKAEKETFDDLKKYQRFLGTLTPEEFLQHAAAEIEGVSPERVKILAANSGEPKKTIYSVLEGGDFTLGMMDENGPAPKVRKDKTVEATLPTKEKQLSMLERLQSLADNRTEAVFSSMTKAVNGFFGNSDRSIFAAIEDLITEQDLVKELDAIPWDKRSQNAKPAKKSEGAYSAFTTVLSLMNKIPKVRENLRRLHKLKDDNLFEMLITRNGQAGQFSVDKIKQFPAENLGRWETIYSSSSTVDSKNQHALEHILTGDISAFCPQWRKSSQQTGSKPFGFKQGQILQINPEENSAIKFDEIIVNPKSGNIYLTVTDVIAADKLTLQQFASAVGLDVAQEATAQVYEHRKHYKQPVYFVKPLLTEDGSIARGSIEDIGAVTPNYVRTTDNVTIIRHQQPGAIADFKTGERIAPNEYNGYHGTLKFNADNADVTIVMTKADGTLDSDSRISKARAESKGKQIIMVRSSVNDTPLSRSASIRGVISDDMLQDKIQKIGKNVSVNFVGYDRKGDQLLQNGSYKKTFKGGIAQEILNRKALKTGLALNRDNVTKIYTMGREGLEEAVIRGAAKVPVEIHTTAFKTGATADTDSNILFRCCADPKSVLDAKSIMSDVASVKAISRDSILKIENRIKAIEEAEVKAGTKTKNQQIAEARKGMVYPLKQPAGFKKYGKGEIHGANPLQGGHTEVTKAAAKMMIAAGFDLTGVKVGSGKFDKKLADKTATEEEKKQIAVAEKQLKQHGNILSPDAQIVYNKFRDLGTKISNPSIAPGKYGVLEGKAKEAKVNELMTSIYHLVQDGYLSIYGRSKMDKKNKKGVNQTLIGVPEIFMDIAAAAVKPYYWIEASFGTGGTNEVLSRQKPTIERIIAAHGYPENALNPENVLFVQGLLGVHHGMDKVFTDTATRAVKDAYTSSPVNSMQADNKASFFSVLQSIGQRMAVRTKIEAEQVIAEQEAIRDIRKLMWLANQSSQGKWLTESSKGVVGQLDQARSIIEKIMSAGGLQKGMAPSEMSKEIAVESLKSGRAFKVEGDTRLYNFTKSITLKEFNEIVNSDKTDRVSREMKAYAKSMAENRFEEFSDNDVIGSTASHVGAQAKEQAFFSEDQIATVQEDISAYLPFDLKYRTDAATGKNNRQFAIEEATSTESVETLKDLDKIVKSELLQFYGDFLVKGNLDNQLSAKGLSDNLTAKSIADVRLYVEDSPEGTVGGEKVLLTTWSGRMAGRMVTYELSDMNIFEPSLRADIINAIKLNQDRMLSQKDLGKLIAHIKGAIPKFYFTSREKEVGKLGRMIDSIAGAQYLSSSFGEEITAIQKLVKGFADFDTGHGTNKLGEMSGQLLERLSDEKLIEFVKFSTSYYDSKYSRVKLALTRAIEKQGTTENAIEKMSLDAMAKIMADTVYETAVRAGFPQERSTYMYQQMMDLYANGDIKEFTKRAHDLGITIPLHKDAELNRKINTKFYKDTFNKMAEQKINELETELMNLDKQRSTNLVLELAKSMSPERRNRFEEALYGDEVLIGDSEISKSNVAMAKLLQERADAEDDMLGIDLDANSRVKNQKFADGDESSTGNEEGLGSPIFNHEGMQNLEDEERKNVLVDDAYLTASMTAEETTGLIEGLEKLTYSGAEHMRLSKDKNLNLNVFVQNLSPKDVLSVGNMDAAALEKLCIHVLSGKAFVVTEGKNKTRKLTNREAIAVLQKSALAKPLTINAEAMEPLSKNELARMKAAGETISMSPLDITPGKATNRTIREVLGQSVLSNPGSVVETIGSLKELRRWMLIQKMMTDKHLTKILGLNEDDPYFAAGINPFALRKLAELQEQDRLQSKRGGKTSVIESEQISKVETGEIARVWKEDFSGDLGALVEADNSGSVTITPEDGDVDLVYYSERLSVPSPWNVSKFIDTGIGEMDSLGGMLFYVDKKTGQVLDVLVEKTPQELSEEHFNSMQADSDVAVSDLGKNMAVITSGDYRILSMAGQTSNRHRATSGNQSPTCNVKFGGKTYLCSISNDMEISDEGRSMYELGDYDPDRIYDFMSNAQLKRLMGYKADGKYKLDGRSYSVGEVTEGLSLRESVDIGKIQAAFQNIANRFFHAKRGNASKSLKVNVFTSLQQAPQAVQQVVEADRKSGKIGASQTPKGMIFADGQVYLFANMHANADGSLNKKAIVQTLIHEVVGHRGIRGVVGAKYDDFLKQVYEKHKAEIGSVGSFEAALKATEEFLAHTLEKATYNEKTGTFKHPKLGSLLDSLVSLVMKPIRAIGNMLGFDIKLTGAEMRNVLTKSFEGVQLERKFGIGGFLPDGFIPGLSVENSGGMSKWEENTGDRFMRRFVKSFYPVELLQKSIEHIGRKIRENEDVDLHRQLMSGRVGAALKAVEVGLEVEYDKTVKQNTLAHNDVALYMKARHAPERNKALFKQALKEFTETYSEKLKAGGLKGVALTNYLEAQARQKVSKITNMTDTKASKVIADFASRGLVSNTDGKYAGKLENAAAIVDKVNAQTIALSKAYGFIGDKDIENMQKQFKYYVPGGSEEFVGAASLQELESKVSSGSRTIKHLSLRRQGESDPVAMSFVRLKQTIVKGEKNIVYKSLYDLILAHPDTATFGVYSTMSGFKRLRAKDETVEHFSARMALQGRHSEKKADGMENKTKEEVFTPQNGYIPIWVEGEKHFVQVKHPTLLKSFLSVDEKQSSSIARKLAKVNRWLIMTNTMLNPEFAFWSNPLRDIGTASLNTALMAKLGNANSTEAAKRLTAKVPGAINALLEVNGTGLSFGTVNPKDIAMAKRFEAAGGMVGMPYLGNPKEVSDTLRKNASKKTPKSGFVNMATGGLEGLAKTLIGATEAVENGTRLAYFITAVESGLSDKEAARGARLLTVDFNQRGEFGSAINSLYLFSNAGIQGTVRILQGIKNNPKKAAKVMGGIIAASFVLAELSRLGSDDDERGKNKYEGIDRETRNSNMVFMWPGSEMGLKIPVPYGFGFFWSVGQKMSEMSHGEINSLDASAGIIDSLINNFNPLGGTGELRTSHDWVRTATPTLMDPVVDILFEKTPFGTPLMPSATDEWQPDSQRHWNSVSSTSKHAAEWINSMTFGSVSSKGLIDVSPESFDLLFDNLTGGSVAFLKRTFNFATNQINGVDTTVSQTPMIRRMVASREPFRIRADVRAAMNTIQSVRQRQNEITSWRDAAQTVELRRQSQKDLAEFNKKYQDILAFRKRANKINSTVKTFDDRKEKWTKSGLPDLEIKKRLQEIAKPQKEVMTRFLREFNEIADRVD